jgi:S-adenosylmethionine-diacylglycerol 3-amino-3-carboxypropyl transferase
MEILYSQCWEDPDIVLSALKITPKDSVFSIASGGENIFAILLRNPMKLLAIDVNPFQIYLIRLKIAAIKALEFDEFVEFLGFKAVAPGHRVRYFHRCKKYLGEQEIRFWRKNKKCVEKGIVHCGKFESYLTIFRKYVLPLVLSKKQIKKYLSLKSLEDQERFFKKEWNTWRWRLFFKIFFSRTVMQRLGRKKQYFFYSKKKNIANHYFERAKYGITKIPVKQNYFMHYILTGTIPVQFKGHPYLDKSNFSTLKRLVDKVELVNSDCYKYLKKTQKSFTKYNLSDIFELFSQKEYEDILGEIARITKNRGIIFYWNNLVLRYIHPNVNDIHFKYEQSAKLFKKNRVFFYSRLIVEEIN